MTLYARALWLRNCGRFTHVSSDFGSQYHTHTFVTGEALYASLTREATWRHAGKFVDLEEDAKKAVRDDYFLCDYDVDAKPIWFTPGVFMDDALRPLPKQRGVVDRHNFNVVDEDRPSTGGAGRAYFVPTYGSIESVLPDHRMFTRAYSPQWDELQRFAIGQTFMLGKKRTMFQIVRLSETAESTWKHGDCMVDWLEVPPDYAIRFQSFEVFAATMRYLIVRGTTRPATRYLEFPLLHGHFCLPDFYLQRTPLARYVE
jgi:hypothetical protein